MLLFVHYISFVVLILNVLQFLLPWKHVNTYLLYILDIKRKKLIVIDTKPIPKYTTDLPYKHYAIQIVEFRLKFQTAFRQLKPDSWEDVHKWEFEHAKGIAEDTNGFSDGWLILQYMAWWDSPQNVHIKKDATMRRDFFIDLLAHEANAWRTRLPGIMKYYL
ncbi:hypothetical protein SETIT_9G163800v2 [Setaria italica]|uniref:Uncharacterized protein n=1 Tax=Setaria italica TaxID=4555 RepID=A0A368SHC4_SETIT|nr:hypothetical protein SETIT_9G163800v2 [Setaria italica]